MNNRKFCFILFFLFLGVVVSNAQDPNRFKTQVDELFNKEYNFSPHKKLVVFAGSSSIRMWKDVQEYFPNYNVINNGFGGSHFSDLIFYYDKLILKQKPEILFIYEGDNDIAGNKKPGLVKRQAKELYNKIRVDLPDTKIIFISPKPSIARENLKKEYMKLNTRLKKFCDRKKNLDFADVWYPAMDENGDVFQDIFIEDGLHMNKKGYDIWGKVISPYLE
ncbi:G-D-S-L family lipolytic protein [Maribellus comscasis]|uniref:G-D-S-L family lipolytic protein n=1 Tax=Maribellus comscasis TaxID=2681766 RepID=A0A6I6JMC6_9BACT|nr:GDSL-type esterase/lipase family protein [Maribellus comscasis]QGY44035.1 G-D-S-L family lipolytic protein [Maribellus comscasis]